MTEAGYPRDLHGYGRHPPDPHWPGNARVAVQFVVNFEEGVKTTFCTGHPGQAYRTSIALAEWRY
jgi:hypothetical protein